MEKEIKISFEGGLDRDTSKNKYKSNNYYNANNLRLTTKDGLSNLALENVLGIETKIDLTGEGVYLGGCSIRDYIYFFTFESNALHLFSFQKDAAAPITPTRHFIGPGGLGVSGLTSSSIIKCVGRYESPNVIKIYWIDGVNPIRYANVASNLSGITDISEFDLLPNFELSQPEITEIIGGNLYAGVYQYAYQFYSKNGAETLFSPISKLISITNSQELSSNDLNYKGVVQGTVTSKGITGTISNTNTLFDRIRIVAIQYEAINTTPKIRIFEDKSITPNSTVYFYDGGDNLGEYTEEEFQIINDSYFIPKELESKDDILFAGNISYDSFNPTYDARAYRYSGIFNPSLPVAHDVGLGTYIILWSNSGNEYIINTSVNVFKKFTATTPYTIANTDTYITSYTLSTIPQDFDCINLFNDSIFEKNNPSSDYLCKYKSNAATIGGEGLNINFTVETYSQTITIDETTTNGFEADLEGTVTNPSYKSFASPYNSSIIRGYQDDEVYRFGIELYDNKGRKSPVKWICDIKMNIIGTSEFFTLSSNKVLAKIPYLKFEVNNLPSEVYAYRIVRVKREESDKSIVSTGLLNSIVKETSVPNYYLPSTGVIGNLDLSPVTNRGITQTNITQFISPEVNFNKNISYKNNDFLKIIGEYHDHDLVYDTIIASSPSYSLISRFNSVNKYSSISDIQNIAIDNCKIVDYKNYNLASTLDEYIGSLVTPYRNIVFSAANSVGQYLRGSSGTTLIITFANGETLDLTNLDQETSTSDQYKPDDCFYAYYKRDNSNQYGGFTFEDRKLNVYIPCSDIKLHATEGTSINVFDGDTFSCFFDYLKTIYEDNVSSTARLHEEIYIPLQTSINCNLRHDDNYHRIRNVTYSYAIKETAGVHPVNTDSYTQLTDLYLYNKVYSQESTLQSNVADDYETPVEEYDVRIKYSDTKTSNEEIDSWTKFRTGNYKEVDPKYGPLNNLVNFRNQILYFQDTGFGMLSINPRSVIQDNNIGVLVLGKGDVIERYDYISTEIGNTNRWGVVSSEKALYWGDNSRNELYSYEGAIRCISRENKVHSYLMGLNITDIVIGVDRDFGEILFVINNGNPLVYNEDIGIFTSFYTMSSIKHFISLPDKLFNHSLSGNSYIREHNSTNVNRCLFNKFSNSSQVSEEASTITLLINPEENKICRFDVFEILHEIFNGSTEILTGLNSIRIWNNYQDSGNVSLVNNSSFVKRFRTWRYNTIRSSTKERIKDSYIFVTLSFTNTSDYRFILHDLNVKYTLIAPK